MKEYRICARCVMDTSDPDIVFNKDGICNHCIDAERRMTLLAQQRQEFNLEEYCDKIKEQGKGKKYDCVIGISGGVDSCYVLQLAVKKGLRPLAVHIDNGWDSELALKNVNIMAKTLGVELFDFKADWKEFSSLQMAFLKASTPDCEIPTDHTIFPILAMIAHKHKVNYCIMGHNSSSESILPRKWSHGHFDWKYIKTVNKKFGTQRLKTYPHFSRADYDYFNRKMNWFNILDFIDYDKEKAKKYLMEEYGWENYGGKHLESFYTKFVQTYILPVKFGYDKRRAHFSSLIASGQMTREDALKELEKKSYDENTIEDDIAYFCQHMKITRREFDDIMALPVKSYWDYPNSETDFMGRLTEKISRLFR